MIFSLKMTLLPEFKEIAEELNIETSSSRDVLLYNINHKLFSDFENVKIFQEDD